MQVFKLLVASHVRHSGGGIKTNTIRAAASGPDVGDDDVGPFFDFDFIVPLYASEGNTTATESGSESDDSAGLTDLDFTIHLDRSRAASPSYDHLFFRGGLLRGRNPDPPKFCASEARASYSKPGSKHKRQLRALSFGSRKFALFYSRDSACSRSSNSSRSTRLFAASCKSSSPAPEEKKLKNNSDIVKRYWSKISKKLTRVGTRGVVHVEPQSQPRAKVFVFGSHRLRKSLSASYAVQSPANRDDSLLEKEDGIEGAIAHCKQSFHHGNGSESDVPLFRSRSDPGKC